MYKGPVVAGSMWGSRKSEKANVSGPERQGEQHERTQMRQGLVKTSHDLVSHFKQVWVYSKSIRKH